MADGTYTILLFMKRRAGLSIEAFRRYYEEHHVPLALRHAKGMRGYVRRYLDPQPHPETGVWEDMPFDVITEISFDDAAVFEATLAYVTTHVMPAEIVEDEQRLFDRSSFRIATTMEHRSPV